MGSVLLSIIKKKIITEMAATVMMARRRAKGVEAMVVVPRMGGRGSTRVVLEAAGSFHRCRLHASHGLP